MNFMATSSAIFVWSLLVVATSRWERFEEACKNIRHKRES